MRNLAGLLSALAIALAALAAPAGADPAKSGGLITEPFDCGGTVMTISHGSGLASSPVPPGIHRIPRTRIDLHYTTGPRLFRGKGSLNLNVENLLDDRTVINFQSGFSGTRFTQGRRILLSLSGSF